MVAYDTTQRATRHMPPCQDSSNADSQDVRINWSAPMATVPCNCAFCVISLTFTNLT